ncbi:MAG TPA: FHA domain-containing protein [Blastocatellia bacterium]|nr:FHA domain-containing protein [Blastocatellia bacterium]
MNPLLSLETNLRKFFDRTGAAFDKLLHGGKGPAGKPSARELSNRLSPSVQKAIDNGLREDHVSGLSTVAPHLISVLLDYNTFAQFEQPELKALKQELEQVAKEHILNRRYSTESAISLKVSYDPLVASPMVRATFASPVVQTVAGASAIRPEASRSDLSPSGRLPLRLRSVNSRFSLDQTLNKLRLGGQPVTVGRGRDNDIVIDDRSVSKFHSTIALTQDGKLIVADVGSSNGTFVNNKAVRGREVVDIGDVIGFGEVEVRLEV